MDLIETYWSNCNWLKIMKIIWTYWTWNSWYIHHLLLKVHLYKMIDSMKLPGWSGSQWSTFISVTTVTILHQTISNRVYVVPYCIIEIVQLTRWTQKSSALYRSMVIILFHPKNDVIIDGSLTPLKASRFLFIYLVLISQFFVNAKYTDCT